MEGGGTQQSKVNFCYIMMCLSQFDFTQAQSSSLATPTGPVSTAGLPSLRVRVVGVEMWEASLHEGKVQQGVGS